jgi:hypothetical protein
VLHPRHNDRLWIVDISSKPDLAEALFFIGHALRTRPDDEKGAAYTAGDLTVQELRPLDRYLVSAMGYLILAPATAGRCFYDVYHATRSIFLVRNLSIALQTLGDSVSEEHRTRIVDARTEDDLDATIFELVVAATYARAFGPRAVHFIPPDPRRKTPEFRVEPFLDHPFFVECKRSARLNSYARNLTEEIDNRLRPVLDNLRTRGLPRAVRVHFHTDPTAIEGPLLLDAADQAATTGKEIATAQYSVAAEPLGPPDTDFVYPSSKYYNNRFGYRPAEWCGFQADVVGPKLGPSVFESTTWDSAVMWRVTDPRIVRRAQKLNFELIFHGLEQLRPTGLRTVLHLWIERSNGWGHRRDLLRKLYNDLERKSELFSYLVINETQTDVTLGGRFDCRAHAHSIGGRTRWMEAPPVTDIWVQPEDIQPGTGEWGVGLELDSLDDAEQASEA